MLSHRVTAGVACTQTSSKQANTITGAHMLYVVTHNVELNAVRPVRSHVRDSPRSHWILAVE